MPRSFRSYLVAGALGAGTLGAVAAPAAALPARTSAFARGLAPLHVAGGRALGLAAPRRMAVTIALAPRNAAALDALVARPHRAITPRQFNARFAPSRATVARVRSWARANRLRVASVSANRLLVRVTGSSAAVGRAFGVRFVSFRAPGAGTWVTTDRTARLPRAFAANVNSVLGLSTLGRFATPHPHPRTAARRAASSGIAFPNQYGPKDFWSLYDAPSSQTGSGQTLAVITEGDLTQPRKDLATFEQKFGLPAVTWNQINVGTPSTDTSGDDEWDLDTQYSTGFAPGVGTLNVYVGPSLSDADIAATLNRWVTDNASRQASFSAGECELLAYVAGFTNAADATLKQAAAQGQTLFTSSGDTGSFCPAVIGVNGVPAGLPGDSYPASSPYAIGVGGTTVLGPGPNELAWYAGGGGASFLEGTPSWQAGAGGSFLGVTRGVPDVALDADPNSGYEVIVAGQEQIIGGTSASAPSWQGIWARAQGAHGGALGFAGPAIYGTPASAFHDITLGANGLYPTTPGWDYTTGRGTPDIAAFVSGA